MRKFKQWLDAEYTVKDVEISRQRLAIDGVFDEYAAVAALVISHKGHTVAIGSGLTARQRVDWAKEPGLIVSTLVSWKHAEKWKGQGVNEYFWGREEGRVRGRCSQKSGCELMMRRSESRLPWSISRNLKLLVGRV